MRFLAAAPASYAPSWSPAAARSSSSAGFSAAVASSFYLGAFSFLGGFIAPEDDDPLRGRLSAAASWSRSGSWSATTLAVGFRLREEARAGVAVEDGELGAMAAR
jgi:hypothetical protein